MSSVSEIAEFFKTILSNLFKLRFFSKSLAVVGDASMAITEFRSDNDAV